MLRYFLETQKGGIKDWLQCRTVGLPMTHNRLLNFHVVRNTRSVQFIFCHFHRSMHVDAEDRAGKMGDYGGSLGWTHKFFYRHESLRHLRPEQHNRYFTFAGDPKATSPNTIEDTIGDDDETMQTHTSHRHYDRLADNGILQGTCLKSVAKHCDGSKRRQDSRLGVANVAFIEPLGERREDHFEQKLLLGLAWFCTHKPTIEANGSIEWTFFWKSPVQGVADRSIAIRDDTAISFEDLCSLMEKEICQQHLNLICKCCCLDKEGVCKSCRFAVGFHYCEAQPPDRMLWRKGTLHDGVAIVERCLFNLHRKDVPLEKLKIKAAEYVAAHHISEERAGVTIRAIEAERNIFRIVNDASEAAPEDVLATSKLNRAQLLSALRTREEQMKTSRTGGSSVPDQWRIYQEIVSAIDEGRYLRMIVQASSLPCMTEIFILFGIICYA